MASSLTFYMAWVDQTATTWSPAYARFDEHVFNLEIACAEGQIPKATVEIVNPRVGLLAPGRQHWAWLSYSPDGGTTLHPLFFGRLIGIPQTILYNTIKCEFVARSPTYIRQKQAVAESLKIAPNYDPIFLDVMKRDDPDAILEGWSSLYAVDRVTGAVSASDILVGEDGTLTIAPEDTFYDSVQMKLQQSPLVAVNVKAEVAWEQQYLGYFYVGQWAYPTLGNEPFVGGWPRSGAYLGGGYYAENAFAGIRDPFIQITTASNIVETFNWTNTARHHIQGDTMSIVANSSLPAQPMTLYKTSNTFQVGIVNPYTTDALGYPDPTNIPAISAWTAVGVRTFALDYAGLEAVAALGLTYQANRKRSEQVFVTLQADVQPILIDPLVTEDTETINLKSGDLSLPEINLLNWSSIAGQPVALGTFIFPDNPLVPGQTSSQICVTAGTAGAVEPVFSNIAGATTADGTVVWSSLGSTPPTEMAQDWVQDARIALGTLLVPKPVLGVATMDAYLAPGNLQNPPLGVATPQYTVLASGTGLPGSTMSEATSPGILGGSTGAQAGLSTFVQPSGHSMYICVQAGSTGQFHTTFNETVGSQTTDGSVVWQCLGAVTLPIGGWPGMTPAASYFPSDRGQQSLQHMICRARAKLRRRARAVQVTFQCRFEAAASISCRMNAALTDARLPGGGAAGKVIGYKLTRDGDSGKTLAEVTIGCTIGNANAITTSVDGVSTYVDGVFNQGEVQLWAGSTTSLSATGDDVGYTPPVQQTVDDGLSFPLQGVGDAVLISRWHGTPSTINQGNIANYNAQVAAAVAGAIAGGAPPIVSGGFTQSGGVTNAAQNQAALVAHINAAVYQGTGLWYELSLKNLTGGPYAAAYVINTTLLALPKTIDLAAPS
jgi:hypothetical protein